VCRECRLGFVYDVHHHRCLPDSLPEKEATAQALETWEHALVPREPLFHLSSPRDGWRTADTLPDSKHAHNPAYHHDYIDPADLPAAWRNLRITVDIEAKAKECAIRQLQEDLGLGRPRTATRKP
jgi:UV DNA damage endonuclease